MPYGHGSYRGVQLELLDTADEDDLMLLLQAQHAEWGEAPDTGEDMIVDGGPFSPSLHLALHQIVANQLLADDPPQTWQTVQRPASMGYDWHNTMHMIAREISGDLYRIMKHGQHIDSADYAGRLAHLPGGWPLPETSGPR